jgi:DNA recombination protein RmuC
MNYLSETTVPFILVTGTLIGIIATWLAMRRKLGRAAQSVARAAADIATLNERLSRSAQEIAQLSDAVNRAGSESRALNDSLRQESEKRAAAEATNLQIEGIRADLERKETRIAQLQAENLSLSSKATRLQTQIEDQITAAEQNLATLNEARDQLSNEFSALSAKALRENNESFLNLAKTALEGRHDGAGSGDEIESVDEIDTTPRALFAR